MSNNNSPLLGALVRRFVQTDGRVDLRAGQTKKWRVNLGEGDEFAFDAIRGRRGKHSIKLIDEDGNVVRRGRRSIVVEDAQAGQYTLEVTNGASVKARMKYQVDRFRDPVVQGDVLPVQDSIAPTPGQEAVPAEPIVNPQPGTPVPPQVPVPEQPVAPVPQIIISMDQGVFTVIDAVTIEYLFDGGAYSGDKLYIQEIGGTGERVLVVDDSTDAALFSALHQNAEPNFNFGEYKGQRHVPSLSAGDYFKLLVERDGVIISDSTLNPEEFAISSRHSQPMMVGTEDVRNGDNDFNDLLVSANGVVGGNMQTRASFGSAPLL